MKDNNYMEAMFIFDEKINRGIGQKIQLPLGCNLMRYPTFIVSMMIEGVRTPIRQTFRLLDNNMYNRIESIRAAR